MAGWEAFNNLSDAINQTALNVAATSIADEKALKNSKKFAEFTNELNLSNWHLQNQRQDFLNENSASIMKNSLLAAGISPAAMTEGSFSDSVSDVGAPAAAMNGHSVAPVDLLGYHMQNKQLAIQQQLADAEVSLKSAQEKAALASAGYTSEQQVTQQKVNEYYDRLANLDIQAKGAIIGNTQAQTKYTEAKNNREESYLGLQKELNQKQLSQIDAVIKEIDQKIKTGIAQAYSYYASGNQAKAQETYIKAMKEGQEYINKAASDSYQVDGTSVKGYQLNNLMSTLHYGLQQSSIDTAIQEAKKRMEYTDHQITFDWSNFAVDTTIKASKEARGWTYGWIPFSSQ